MTVRRLGRRDVGLAVALIAGAAGVVAEEPSLAIAATVGLIYSAYEAFTDVPDPDLTVTRSVDPGSPAPGEEVDVTVTLRNEGTDALPDVRVVDGVPRTLRVVDGSPRFGTALEPDEAESFSYTVRARRGDHEFRPATVLCRDLPGTAEFRESVRVETPLSCSIDVEEISLGDATLAQPGRVEADVAGQGVTFFGVRDYQSTDPLSHVDWNRFARTNELATVEYEATRSASVVLLVDARSEFAPRPRAPTATQLSKYAAERIGTALLGEQNHVGAAFLDSSAYLQPRAHRTQALRLRRFLLYEADPATVDRDGADDLLDGFDGRAFFQGPVVDPPTPTGTDGRPSADGSSDGGSTATEPRADGGSPPEPEPSASADSAPADESVDADVEADDGDVNHARREADSEDGADARDESDAGEAAESGQTTDAGDAGSDPRADDADAREGTGAADPADDGSVADATDVTYDRSVGELDRRFPDAAQVVFCTPLLDRWSATVARRLAARGRSVTLVSPDVTSNESPGRTVERITRSDRIARLRGRIRVVDWSPDEPLTEALSRSVARWSR